MASRGDIEALLYLLDEAFGGRGADHVDDDRRRQCSWACR